MKKIEIPSTPRRRAKLNDGISAKWKVSWKPPLLKFSAPTRITDSRKEIPEDSRANLYWDSEFQLREPAPLSRITKEISGSTSTRRRRSNTGRKGKSSPFPLTGSSVVNWEYSVK